ncbi:MAG: Smr/MutS family protein [Tannerellaceae bacterium]|jgi:DNA mismatch repair protein MutS2|nr:Smr/MutS family protein [Tannerellaceae bacterium]
MKRNPEQAPTYPRSFEKKTGFDSIRRLVGGKCLCPSASELAYGLRLSTDYATVSVWLDQAGEFLNILRAGDSFPIDNYFDLRFSLNEIGPAGTFIDKDDLRDMQLSLKTIADIVKFLNPDAGQTPAYPSLAALTSGVMLFPDIIRRINAIIDEDGEIRDNASPGLLKIRREIDKAKAGISGSLYSIVRAAQAEGIIGKDVFPTMRDGRLMIPVAQAFKRKIRGIVHDESATGKTVFIEPEAIVEANNRIRELEGEERREIVKILTAFTDTIRPFADDLIRSYNFLVGIDFIRAKALFAVDINAIRPQMDDMPQLDWIRAVHPLLYLSHLEQARKSKPVVPLDIQLSADNRLLLVSGPNAGGKSVCLKTAGLLQYMLQCGLLIPVGEGSRTGIFSGIFIDIGDEQSIENDLSTYSSHLINMKYFLKNCSGTTLLLIDEFGSGTEPRIGGAIAEALLDRFNRNKSYGIITTHYQNLKDFAQNTPGIINGAMLYDRQLMRPLFQLSTGNQGSSFAVEIARMTGLPEEIINDASAKVGEDYINLDKYLQDIVRDKRYWETKRRNIRQEEKKIEEAAARYEEELATIDKDRKELLRQAREDAARILAEANAKIENTIREIKESQADKVQTGRARKSLDVFKASLDASPDPDDKLTRRLTALKRKKVVKPDVVNNNTAIASGDLVRLKGQTAPGVVMDIDRARATVAFGTIKSVVAVDKLDKLSKGQLRKDERANSPAANRMADGMRERRLNFTQELDVRGMRGEEALQAVAYHVDDAVMFGVSPVRILHGTGSGVLRQLIRDYLHSAHGVASCRDEHVQFGGSGVTVVELD